MFEKEHIYIAGPECFYSNGNEILAAMKQKAESCGFKVTLPNNHPLSLDNEDLRQNAHSIFADLEIAMNESTVIIADLEAFRGAEPDSGTIYEIGMAFARGIKCYGYTRDKRILAVKNQGSVLRDGVVYDEKGRKMPYAGQPFASTVIGSVKIIEGGFDDCLKMLMVDLEEEYKMKGLGRSMTVLPSPEQQASQQPRIYLSGFERYDDGAAAIYQQMKELCGTYGFKAVSPLDPAGDSLPANTENIYEKAAGEFNRYQQHVRSCDIILANLNDFRGYEISNDTGFECGMGFGLGKKLYGYMDNTQPMIERVPHRGRDGGYRDQGGSNVENFNYPVNLMFACSMTIFEGRFNEIIKAVANDYADCLSKNT